MAGVSSACWDVRSFGPPVLVDLVGVVGLVPIHVLEVVVLT